MAQTEKSVLTKKEEIERIVKGSKKTSFKDLPRLTKRITIIDNIDSKNKIVLSKGILIENNNDNDNKEEKKENDTIWNRISSILLCLAKHCVLTNKTDQNELVYNTLNRVLNDANTISNMSHHAYDMELFELFNKNKILNCNVINILNGCNQLVIFGAFAQLLKEYFMPQGFNGMKDVRSENGWQIEIYFNPSGVIRILHKRQTQYAKPPNEPFKHFIVNWELDMSFAKKLIKCNSVFVRVTGIEFHKEVDPDYKLSVKTKLVGGDVIFH